MIRPRNMFVFAILWILLGSPAASDQQPGLEKGFWSLEATRLPYVGAGRNIRIVAPDGRKVVMIEGAHLRVVSDGKELRGVEQDGIATLAELGWSPDSRAFFVTESDGGIVGSWSVRTYVIGSESVRRVAVQGQAARRAKARYQCKEPEEPNVAAIAWTRGSSQIMLAAEVPPHSSCRDMGKLWGFLVSAGDGKVLSEFSEQNLRSTWGQYLGERFHGK